MQLNLNLEDQLNKAHENLKVHTREVNNLRKDKESLELEIKAKIQEMTQEITDLKEQLEKE